MTATVHSESVRAVLEKFCANFDASFELASNEREYLHAFIAEELDKGRDPHDVELILLANWK